MPPREIFTIWRVFFLLVLCTLPRMTQAADAEATPITLEVDASESARHLVHVHLSIPTRPGSLTLYYPKWIPGNHAPTGPIADLAGLRFQVGGKTIPWQRDEVDPYAFHCVIPQDGKALEVNFDLLNQAGSDRLAVLNWNQLLLYPKSAQALQERFQPAVRFPERWKFGTALTAAGRKDGRVLFAPVTLELLIDSPVLCGEYLREIPLGPEREPRHSLIVACDSEAGLELTPDQKACYDRLITEANRLFGARHYRSYRFLLALSDRMGYSGLEHHESSDNRLPERGLTDPVLRKASAGLLPHEFVHSWNGKYRRPADMITPDYQEPHRTKLLWVYEGLTHYLMFVLTARCGLWTPDESRESLALLAETLSNQRGRTWRPLDDTTTGALLLRQASPGWNSWRRMADYYDEGILLWLEVDTIIRRETKGKRSLDDFCRKFFGGASGPPTVKAYTFDELVKTLNEVAPYDWKRHLTRRVSATTDHSPQEGIEQAGWRLTFGEKPTSIHQGQQTMRKTIDLRSSIGLVLGPDGAVKDVIAGKAADRAGIGPGMKLLAVNGRRWSSERLQTAIAQTRDRGKLELLLENGDFFRTFALDYHDGARYPRLQRTSGETPDLISEILKPLAEARK